MGRSALSNIRTLFARALGAMEGSQEREKTWAKVLKEDGQNDDLIGATRLEIAATREKMLATPPNAKVYLDLQQEKLKQQQTLVSAAACPRVAISWRGADVSPVPHT